VTRIPSSGIFSHPNARIDTKQQAKLTQHSIYVNKQSPENSQNQRVSITQASTEMIRQFRDSTSPLGRIFKSAPILNNTSELQQLRAENARYQSLIDNAPLGYLTVNRHTLIIDTNRAGAGLLGKTASQIRNTQLYKYLPVRDHDSSVSMRTEIHQYRKTIPVMLYLTPVVPDKNSEPLCQITVLDLSEHKAAEDYLRIARDGLQHVANHDCLTRLPNPAAKHRQL